jgi:hypothetical protein
MWNFAFNHKAGRINRLIPSDYSYVKNQQNNMIIFNSLSLDASTLAAFPAESLTRPSESIGQSLPMAIRE